jgi:putative ABC transport system substrate-binding protein
MRRRHLIGLIAASCPLASAALAQQAASRRPRVVWLGVLSADTIDPRQIEEFRKGLAENGLFDGETADVQYLWAGGSVERLNRLAAEIVHSDADVIVTAGPQPVRALLAAGATQPIVMAVASDAVESGLVKSLASPDGPVTGLSISNTDLEARRIELLKELVPSLGRVLVLHDPSMAAEGLEAARQAAATLGIEALVVEAADPAAFGSIFAAAVADRADGVSTMASPFFNYNRESLIALAARHRLPSMWESAVYVRDGGLASYGPSFPDMFRRSAGYVARLLKGARPAELPIEQPTAFDLVLNRRTADRLGLVIPPDLLARAAEVVE